MSNNGPWRAPPKNTGQTPGAADGLALAPPNEPTGPPPEDVHTAWVLWLAATAFALVGMVLNALTSRFQDMPVSTRDAVRDAAENAGDAAPSIDTVFTMAMVLGSGLAVLAAAVTVWLAFRLRAGKGWARTMLNIVAIFLVVDAIAVVIGVFGGAATVGTRGEGLTFTIYCFQILAGLCAVTAVWRQHTAEAMAFTSPEGQRGKD